LTTSGTARNAMAPRDHTKKSRKPKILNTADARVEPAAKPILSRP
jgi:hypothetical protein